MDHAKRLNALIDLAATEFKAGANSSSSINGLPKPNLFFTTSVLGMQAISRVIEDQALSQGHSFRLYSAFQKLSRYQQQRERYEKILATKNPVYIFGIPDNLPANRLGLTVVPLERSARLDQISLANNWFVILHNPQLVSMALIAREIPSSLYPGNVTDSMLYRSFEGFWTYDKNIIDQAVQILDDYMIARRILRPASMPNFPNSAQSSTSAK
jgi:DICT domain-containing protein